jgi:hypothetical protein
MPSKHLLFLLLISLCLINTSVGQDSVILIKNCPVKSGIIKVAHENLSGYHDFAEYVNIIAEEDTAFAMYASKVVDTFSLDSSLYIIMAISNRRKIIYGNLVSINVKKGDNIKVGQVVGIIKMESDKKYELLVKLMDGINQLSYEEHLSLFRKRKQL